MSRLISPEARKRAIARAGVPSWLSAVEARRACQRPKDDDLDFYWNDLNEMTVCCFCGVPRWQHKAKQQEEGNDES
jgi:hypothetical protein